MCICIVCNIITDMRPVHKMKIKYYSKEILKYLLAAGILTIAASSPYFPLYVIKSISRRRSKKDKQKTKNAFAYLKRKGWIDVRRSGHDIEIRLTREGKERVGKYQIDDLFIPRPRKWDHRWRIVTFDIPIKSSFVRNVFRRKLKELGFYSLQKSVWIHPFECQEEITLLRDFLGVDTKQIRVIEAVRIEDDRFLRDAFQL